MQIKPTGPNGFIIWCSCNDL